MQSSSVSLSGAAAVALMVFVMSVAVVNAQLPQPYLTSVFPAGGQAGSSVEVKIGGTELDEAELRFDVPGIVAKRDAKDAKKFTVTIAKEVKPGLLDVRVTSKLGVSNPRCFQVGQIEETINDGKHHQKEAAMDAKPPLVINGTAASQQDDWFKLSLKKGQTIRAKCWADSLDSKLVPLLSMMDVTGHEVARGKDDILYTAGADGVLWLKLHDYLYRGSADYFYRLELGEAKPKPAPKVVVNDVAVRDVTLPLSLSLPVTSKRSKAQLKFNAKKGDVWWLSATSTSKSDLRIVLQRLEKDKTTDVLELNDGPAVPGMPDYDGSSLDPSGKWEVKDEGEYLLTLQNLMQETNADQTYQLAVQKPKPDFQLVAIPVPPKENKPGKDFNGPVVTVSNHNLHRGEVLPVRVIVERKEGFDGEIKLKAEVAAAGITAAATMVSNDTADTMVFLTADEKATAGDLTLNVMAESGQTKRAARGTTTLWNLALSDFIEPSRWRFTQQMVVGVREDVYPVTITTDAKLVEVKLTEKAKVSVKVARRGDFKDALKLKPAGVPGIEKAKELEVAATASSADYEVDVPTLNLKPGAFTFWFTGTAKMKVKGKDATVNVYSQPIVLQVSETTKPAEAPKKP